uniref:Uncharacterized protein n=1 Tax=viral metagenome TaxID=1070528 RepID=A0A6M3LFT3_9ZZZZ
MKVTVEMLREACASNPWLNDEEYPTWDYTWDAPTVFADKEALLAFFRGGNCTVRYAVQYHNLVFINQDNGGDEWLTIKLHDGRLHPFESITFHAVIRCGDIYFHHMIEDMEAATLEQCKSLSYLGARLNSLDIHVWPYHAMDRMWEAGDHSWREVGEEIFYDQMECVPPAKMSSITFAVGEAWKSDKTGIVHAMFCKTDGRFFARHDYLANFNPIAYREQIRKQREVSNEPV